MKDSSHNLEESLKEKENKSIKKRIENLNFEEKRSYLKGYADCMLYVQKIRNRHNHYPINSLWNPLTDNILEDEITRKEK